MRWWKSEGSLIAGLFVVGAVFLKTKILIYSTKRMLLFKKSIAESESLRLYFLANFGQIDI